MPVAGREIIALVLLAPVGCALGPKAIEQTHGKYATAVQRVDEEQFLKNVVRLRYVEAPKSLDITSIAAQYEIAAAGELRPFFGTESVTGPFFRSFSTVLPDFQVSGANRPTVSLIPQDDGSVVRQFLTPITGETLVFLAQSGWPAASVLRVWVDKMNGVPNYVPASGPARQGPADFARFHRACELLQAAQEREFVSIHSEERAVEVSDPLPADAVTAAAAVEAAKHGFEYRRRADGRSWVLVKKEPRLDFCVNPVGHGSPELAELSTLLNLRPGLDRYELKVTGGVPDPGKNPSEPSPTLRLGPRSTAQALFFLANGVDVPAEHVAGGLVHLPDDGTDPTEATRGLFHVHSCRGSKHHRPECAYVAYHYRDHWYYIDDRDRETKATLMLMLELRRLDFKRQQIGSIPALTLPVGR